MLDRVKGYQETEAYKKAYRKRTVWVEPLFAEGKDWHGMRRFRLRLLWRVNCEALMRAAGQNLKWLLKSGAGDGSHAQQRPYVPSFGSFQVVDSSFLEYRSYSSPIGSHYTILMEEYDFKY